MQPYKDVYSGVDYIIHFKYSGVLSITYLTLMYGVGMPILFPIAAFNFFNQWIVERIIVAYVVRIPPSLDIQLTRNCIKMLEWAPLLLLFNGYWMVSNKQIFMNSWLPINTTNDSMRSDHFFWFGVNWASPLLLISIASVALVLLKKLFESHL